MQLPRRKPPGLAWAGDLAQLQSDYEVTYRISLCLRQSEYIYIFLYTYMYI